jgi:hypothetical protein
VGIFNPYISIYPAIDALPTSQFLKEMLDALSQAYE